MALVSAGITSVTPQPQCVSVAVFMEAGQAWAQRNHLNNVPLLLLGEIGYTLALVGDSRELLQETRAKLRLPETREVSNPLRLEERQRKERGRAEKLDAKLDVRLTAKERRDLDQWARRAGRKASEYARELLQQGVAFDRALALEKQRQRP